MRVTPDDAKTQEARLELSGGVNSPKRVRGGAPEGARARSAVRWQHLTAWRAPHPLVRLVEFALFGAPPPFIGGLTCSGLRQSSDAKAHREKEIRYSYRVRDQNRNGRNRHRFRPVANDPGSATCCTEVQLYHFKTPDSAVHVFLGTQTVSLCQDQLYVCRTHDVVRADEDGGSALFVTAATSLPTKRLGAVTAPVGAIGLCSWQRGDGSSPCPVYVFLWCCDHDPANFRFLRARLEPH